MQLYTKIDLILKHRETLNFKELKSYNVCSLAIINKTKKQSQKDNKILPTYENGHTTKSMGQKRS